MKTNKFLQLMRLLRGSSENGSSGEEGRGGGVGEEITSKNEREDPEESGGTSPFAHASSRLVPKSNDRGGLYLWAFLALFLSLSALVALAARGGGGYLSRPPLAVEEAAAHGRTTQGNPCTSDNECGNGLSRPPAVDGADVHGRILPESQCASEERTITVVLRTDKDPDETSWDVKNPSGDIILSGGGYTYPNDMNTQFTNSVNVCPADTSGTFSFTIYDSYGDGICCRSGTGSYKVTLDGVEVASGGSFGIYDGSWSQIPSSETKDFPVVGQDLPGGERTIEVVIVADDSPWDTTWVVKNPSGGAIMSGSGWVDQVASNTNYTKSVNVYPAVTFGIFSFEIKDSKGNGFQGSYAVKLDGVEVVSGEPFSGSSETWNFEVPVLENCTDGADNNGDSLMDCSDYLECSVHENCNKPTGETCDPPFSDCATNAICQDTTCCLPTLSSCNSSESSHNCCSGHNCVDDVCCEALGTECNSSSPFCCGVLVCQDNGNGTFECAEPDEDGDEVADAEDLCHGTPPGEDAEDAVVDEVGCSIVDHCPCDTDKAGETWKNHGQFVKCVARMAETFLGNGIIADDEKDDIVGSAGNSSCGNKK